MSFNKVRINDLKALKPKRARQGTRNAKIPLEDKEMQALHDYLTLHKIPHTHVANERMASVAYKKKLASMGVSKGFPDMLIFLPDVLVAVELKRSKKSLSKVSDEQEDWIETLNMYEYARAKVCYGADEAIEFIKEWISGKNYTRHYPAGWLERALGLPSGFFRIRDIGSKDIEGFYRMGKNIYVAPPCWVNNLIKRGFRGFVIDDNTNNQDAECKQIYQISPKVKIGLWKRCDNGSDE